MIWREAVAERDDGNGPLELIAERADGGDAWTRLVIEKATDAAPPTDMYVAEGGSITAPTTWGRQAWWTYTPTLSATMRRALVGFGDSTVFGAGGLYSLLSEVRKAAVEEGYADGGKGPFAGLEQELVYDPPEINGVPGEITMGNPGDGFDTLVGSWFRSITQGAVQQTQFREDNLRLWYTKRYDGDEATWSLSTVADGVIASGTIDCHRAGDPQPMFEWVPDLPPGIKTLTVTNTGGGHLRFMVDGVNDVGLQVQKQAMSGMTFLGMFFGQSMPAAPYVAPHDGFRFQAPLGLVPNTVIQGSNGYTGMSLDTSYPAAARINAACSVVGLGFNDLTDAGGNGVTPPDGTTPRLWVEFARRYGAACRAANIDGVLMTTQLPYNRNWYTHGIERYNAVKAEALAQGLAFVDLFHPIGGPSLDYTGGENNPHLNKLEYVTQGRWLWDNLLSPTSPAALAMAS